MGLDLADPRSVPTSDGATLAALRLPTAGYARWMESRVTVRARPMHRRDTAGGFKRVTGPKRLDSIQATPTSARQSVERWSCFDSLSESERRQIMCRTAQTTYGVALQLR